jgi:hypothetical protein
MIPKTLITGKVFYQNGQPADAVLKIQLEQTAIDPDHGKILPSEQTVTPNPDGLVSFTVWPNQRAVEPTLYRLKIFRRTQTLADWRLDVPDQPEADLMAVIIEP